MRCIEVFFLCSVTNRLIKSPKNLKQGVVADRFNRLLTEQVLPWACMMRGSLFSGDARRAEQALQHAEKAYAVYCNICKERSKPPYEPICSMRQLLHLLVVGTKSKSRKCEYVIYLSFFLSRTSIL